MTAPLWYAGRVDVAGAGALDVLNFAHPESPRAWVVEVLVRDNALAGGTIAVELGSNLRMASGGLKLDVTPGATGYARVTFGAMGAAGTIRVDAAGAPGTSEWTVNALVTEVSTMPIGNNVTAW